MDYKHPNLVFADTGKNIELDIYLPSLALAFEYQGEYHFFPSFRFDPDQTVHVRDTLKKKLCEGAGITLIPIPFWWDISRESLIAEISKRRKDLQEKYNWKTDLERAIPEHIDFQYRRVFEPLEIK